MGGSDGTGLKLPFVEGLRNKQMISYCYILQRDVVAGLYYCELG